MEKSVKGALLSGLVFPGLGQIALRQPWRGIAFAGGTAAALYALIGSLVSSATTIAEAILNEGDIPGLDSITSASGMVSQAAAQPGLKLASAAILGLWVLSVVDAFRIGRRLDVENKRRVESLLDPARDPDPVRFEVTETFDIAGRGAVVVAYGVRSDLPVGRLLSFELTTPEGRTIRGTATKELMLRRTNSGAIESEAFVLKDHTAAVIPAGSTISVSHGRQT